MSKEQAAEEEYRNKAVINQRGASVEVNNTTDKEAINISQYSGSNIKIENLVTSELATNNKQTKVNNDSFETVLNNKTVYSGKDLVNRVVENTYDYKGFSTEDEINAAKEWKETYRPIANKNSEFEILQGGQSFPGNTETQRVGERFINPTKNQQRKVIDDVYPEVQPEIPNALEGIDEVTDYTYITPAPNTGKVFTKTPSTDDIETGSGSGGNASKAVGVVEYGPDASAATEAGIWEPNPSHQQLPQDIIDIQSKLNPD
jgi:hypothetical protein